MAKISKERASAIGRRSRRKGKAFERQIAALFRQAFDYDWQTTRNSGRTDLPGDIYCRDRQTIVCVECKHRQNWTIRDFIKGNQVAFQELQIVVDNWEKDHTEEYPVLWVIFKDEHGLWITFHGTKAPQAYAEIARRVFRARTSVTCGGGGCTWYLLGTETRPYTYYGREFADSVEGLLWGCDR